MAILSTVDAVEEDVAFELGATFNLCINGTYVQRCCLSSLIGYWTIAGNSRRKKDRHESVIRRRTFFPRALSFAHLQYPQVSGLG